MFDLDNDFDRDGDFLLDIRASKRRENVLGYQCQHNLKSITFGGRNAEDICDTEI